MEDFEEFKRDGIPFIRTGIALLIYLVKNWRIEDCYVTADKFTNELLENLK